LSPGTYILKGGAPGENGSLNVSGGTLKGTGVTLYNTGTSPSYADYKPIDMQNNASITLTAPTSGVLAGILFFQDRSIPTTAHNVTQGNVLYGTLTGALYFPFASPTPIGSRPAARV
jgi:hypothetical protein